MRRAVCLLLILGLCAGTFSWVSATSSSSPSSWVNPTDKALKRVSTIPTAQHEPSVYNNLDCQLLTYRLVNNSDMRSGCFTPTAYGMMDSANNVIIFNGTDEGIPLIPKANGTSLVPWPNASTLIVLSHLSTGGSHISLYSSPLSAMQDERNMFFQLVAKRLVNLPDIQLKDAAGQRLVINSGTMAISDGGSWLVAETLTGSFVRINLTTLDTKLFAPSYASGGLASRVAVSDDGRYVAIQNKNYEHFKVHDLASCNGNTCSSYNYHSFVNSKVSIKLTSHLRFVNKDQLSIEITAVDSTQSGVYHLAPRDSITSLTDYVGLGDSYTSGEGAFNYRDGTDTEHNQCHQSVHAYPALITKNLFTSPGGHSVACSGARINDIGNSSDTYRGQIRAGPSLGELKRDKPELLESVELNFVPGYISQQRFVKRWQPKIVTVSIGGNDVGFGDILQQCVMPKVSRHHSDSTCFNTFEDRVEVRNLADRTVPRWTALYKQLQASSPGTQVYVIGYPDIIDDTGNCAINVKLGQSELVFAKELLVYINERIQKSADDAGVPYIDISKALIGHRLCETKSHNVAVNGLTAGRDRFVLGRESYHPNALGHQLIAQAIMQKTNNLTLKTTPEPTERSNNLLDAAPSGRNIYNRIPASFTASIVGRENIAIGINSGLLKPSSNYTVRINGPSGLIIYTGTSGLDGELAPTITLPAEIPSGPHTIDVIGEGQTGEETHITQPIYIPVAPDDTDGDGVPNSTDSCPAIVNSGQDIDEDGVDDVCDSLIDTPATPVVQDDDPDISEVEPLVPSQLYVATLSHPSSTTSIIKLNSGPTINPVIRSEIYHGVGVKANNASPWNTVKHGGNLGFQSSKHIKHKDPWVAWWIYLFMLPFLLLGALRLLMISGSFLTRLKSKVPGAQK